MVVDESARGKIVADFGFISGCSLQSVAEEVSE